MYLRLAGMLLKPAVLFVAAGILLSAAGVDVFGIAWTAVTDAGGALLDWLANALADRLTDLW